MPAAAMADVGGARRHNRHEPRRPLVAVRMERLRCIDVDEADLLGTTGERQRANTQGARFILKGSKNIPDGKPE